MVGTYESFCQGLDLFPPLHTGTQQDLTSGDLSPHAGWALLPIQFSGTDSLILTDLPLLPHSFELALSHAVLSGWCVHTGTCVCMGTRAMMRVWRQMTTLWGQFSSSIFMCVLEVELGLLGLRGKCLYLICHLLSPF